jgi:hypothetical protein
MGDLQAEKPWRVISDVGIHGTNESPRASYEVLKEKKVLPYSSCTSCSSRFLSLPGNITLIYQFVINCQPNCLTAGAHIPSHFRTILPTIVGLASLDVQGRRLPEDVHTCTSPLSGTLCFAAQWLPGRSVSHAQGRRSRFNLPNDGGYYCASVEVDVPEAQRAEEILTSTVKNIFIGLLIL